MRSDTTEPLFSSYFFMLQKIFFDVAYIGSPCCDGPVMLHATLGNAAVSERRLAPGSDVRALASPYLNVIFFLVLSSSFCHSIEK